MHFFQTYIHKIIDILLTNVMRSGKTRQMSQNDILRNGLKYKKTSI